MSSIVGSEIERSSHSGPLTEAALCTLNLKLTYLDWKPETTLIHFKGYSTELEEDYATLHVRIQSVAKTKAALNVGEICLVEDWASARWFRGRVENRKEDLYDVFLIDRGETLSVDATHISSCSSDLFILPPKRVCGFLANVLLLQSCPRKVMEKYLSSLIGRNITGVIQARLPENVLLLEATDVNSELVQHGFGRHVDKHTFLFLVEMLTEVPHTDIMKPVPDDPGEQHSTMKPPNCHSMKDFLTFGRLDLHCGMRTKVRVTAAVNPGLFYCQIASLDTELQEISKKFATMLENKKQGQETPVELGLLCSVKGKDGNWYRGAVPFVPVNSEVTVLFVDYGFWESVKVENIRSLPPDLCSSPNLAFRCSLSCLTGQDKVIETQQLSYLKAGLLGSMLDLEISSFDEEQHLSSVTVFGVADDLRETKPIQKLLPAKLETVTKSEDLSLRGGCFYHDIAMENALKKAIKAEEWQIGADFLGYAVQVQNPSHFWIRTEKRNSEFEEMMTEMTNYFSQVKLDEKVLSNLQLGTLCCAMYEKDKHFYRAVVTDILEKGAEVLFIDFGNIEKVPHMLIKIIPETFARKPPFAICCTLANVFPLDGFWTSSLSDFLRKFSFNKVFLIHVVQIRKNKISVDLIETESLNNIAELMISTGQVECPLMEPRWYSNFKNVTSKPKRLHCKVTPAIFGNPEQLSNCGEGECTNEIKTGQVAVSFKALNLKPGSEFSVHSISICSLSEFYCQPLQQAPALRELMIKVQQHYSTHTVPLQEGVSCCMAKSSQDGIWYRAIIREKQTDHTSVMLIDYGNILQVKEHDLQAVLPEYAHLEKQAFRCSFSNLITPTDPKDSGNWSPEVCNVVKDFVFKSSGDVKCQVFFQLNVENKGVCHVVDLYDTQSKQSVTKTLIDRGLAREATHLYQPTVFPETFVYSSYDLRPGDEKKVHVTSVPSQFEVYCHLDQNTEIIDELEEKVFEESKGKRQDETGAVEGKLCLVKYFDGRWYRALVQPGPLALYYDVFYVDYGSTNIVEKSQVMCIPSDSLDLLYTPMQALRCFLDSVPRDELFANVKEVLDAAVLNKPVTAAVRKKNDDGSFDVELFDGDVSINKKIKELTYSLASTISPIKSQPEEETFSFPAVKIKRRSDSEHIQRRNSGHKKPSLCKAKNDTIVKLQKRSKIEQQKHCQNKKLEQLEQPASQIPQPPCLPRKNLNAGFKAECFVSHIDSVTRFFLQLSEDEPAILEMSECLNSSTFRDSLKKTTSVRIGDLVVAPYEDGALYRAVVKTCKGSSSFEVEFVDYGNKAIVSRENIYCIPKECQSQPRLSISCSPFDKSKYKNDASFSDSVMEKPLMVDFVVQRGANWEVNIEILEGEVDVTLVLEAALSDMEAEFPRSPDDSTKNMESCEEKSPKAEVTSQSKRVTPPVQMSTSETPPSKSLTQLKVQNISDSNIDTCSINVIGECTEAFLSTDIQAKERVIGTVLAVKNINCFYARLTRNNDLLTALEGHITQNFYNWKALAIEDLKEGLKCLVKTQKDGCQRAVVQHANEEQYKVFLVDHGVTKLVPINSIREQCTCLAKIPNLAVLCLDNNNNNHQEDNHQLWPQPSKLITGKKVELSFLQYLEDNNIWVVEINPLFSIHQVRALLPENEILELAEAKKEAIEDGPTLHKSPPPQLVFAAVSNDKAYLGSVSTVTTPFDFYVVLQDSHIVMDQLSTILNDTLEKMCPVPEAHLVPGTCCLYKSSINNKWYRAEIVKVDATLTLKFVDHGHYKHMELKDRHALKQLPAELINLPKVCYPCVLRGINPASANGQWSNEAVVFFQLCLFQKNIQIFFRELISNTHWKVDVLADGVHMAKELVDAGHADYVDALLGFRFQEIIHDGTRSQSHCSEKDSGQSDQWPEEDEATDEANGTEPQSTTANECDLM